MSNNKTIISFALIATSLGLPGTAAVAADEDPMQALAACARIEDAAQRTACYDQLAEQALEESEAAEMPEPASPAAESTAAPAAAAPAAVASEPQAEPEPPAVSPENNEALAETEDPSKKPIYGHVRKCQQASDRRWFFFLENGDIWKQSGGKIRRFSDCDFDVVFRKDFFGYKMHIDGDEDPVRVRRHD